MAIVKVGQSAGATASGTAAAVTATYASTAGNTLVAVVQHQGADVTSVTDSAGNVWTKVVDTQDLGATSQRRVGLWWVKNAAAVSSVTATCAATSAFGRLMVFQFSGVGGLRGSAALWNSAGVTNVPVAAVDAVEVGDYVLGVLGMGSTGRLSTTDTAGGYTELAYYDAAGSTTNMTVAGSLRTTVGATGPHFTVTSSTTGSATLALYPSGSKPTANAGGDQAHRPWETVVLAGDGFATSGTITSYTWTGPAGITLTGTGQNRTFTAPASLTDAAYSFALTVTDSAGLVSDPDTITVTVSAAKRARLNASGTWVPQPRVVL